METATARHLGARLLAEIEEESLEELLKTIRTRLRAETLPAANTDTSSTSRPLNVVSTSHLSTTTQPAPTTTPQPHTPFPLLKAIIARHQKATQSAPPPVLNVSGRYLPFLYHLVSTLISTPAALPQEDRDRSGELPENRPCGYTVVIVDAECRFDVTRLAGDALPSDPDTKTNTNSAPAPLRPDEKGESEDAEPQQPYPQTQPAYPATLSDLRHVYVYRPAHSQVRAAIAAAADFMLYGAHQSRNREWWGTIVVGSSGLSSFASTSTSAALPSTSRTTPATAPADVLTGYKGWLRVDRADQVPGFHIGISAEEALADRERRAEVVGKGEGRWRATSRWGSYAFGC